MNLSYFNPRIALSAIKFNDYKYINNNFFEKKIINQDWISQLSQKVMECKEVNKDNFLTLQQINFSNQNMEFSESKCVPLVKQLVSKILLILESDKNIPRADREIYVINIKQIDWTLSKITPKWPEEIQIIIQKLKKQLENFHNLLTSKKSSSFLICGSNKNEKSIETTFKNIYGYQRVFEVIGIYQDKKILQTFLNAGIQKARQQERKIFKQKQQQLVKIQKVVPVIIKEPKELKEPEKCQYCDLYLALSNVKPNNYVVKKLINKLENTEYIKGFLYEQGKIFQKDISKAMKYYQKAAQKKDPDAYYRLGNLNQQGYYGKSYQHIQLWKKAAEKGSLEAMTDLGFIYQKGLTKQESDSIIVPSDQKKAHEYYLKAAQKHFPRALNNLGSFYLTNPNFKNPQKAVKYFEDAIQAGYIKSYFNLSICYSENIVSSDNKQETVHKLLKRGAFLGDDDCKLFYIQRILNSDISVENQETQLNLINQYCRQLIAAQQDRAEAYYFLGQLYQKGYGVDSEPKTALLYYSKAMRLGYARSKIKIGDFYRIGFGVQKDYIQALRYYEQVRQKFSEVLLSIGMIYQEGSEDVKRNYEKAFEYYYEACNQNIAEGYLKLGSLYKFGRHVKKDQKKAEQYFRKGEQLSKKNKGLIQSRSQLLKSRTVIQKRRKRQN